MEHIREATAIGIYGTWAKDDVNGWTRPGSSFANLMRAVCQGGGISMVEHDPYWSRHENGLLAETLWQRVRGHADFPAWREGGKRFAKALLKQAALDVTYPYPLLVISHSHGAQVVAYALDALRTDERWLPPANSKGEPCKWVREVYWLAVDPPVRRELSLVYDSAYQSLCLRSPWVLGPRLVQTRSSGKDWKSWPRWAGARRPPWDAARLVEASDVPLVAQPGGHSDVLRYPWINDVWWYSVINRFQFGGGKPVMAEAD